MAKGQTPSVIVGHFPSITKCFSTFSTPIQMGLKTKLVKFSSAYWTFVFQALLSVTACLHGYLQKEKFDRVQSVTHLGLPKPHFNRWLPYINVTEGLVTFQSLYVFHLNQYFRFWLGIFYTSVSTCLYFRRLCMNATQKHFYTKKELRSPKAVMKLSNNRSQSATWWHNTANATTNRRQSRTVLFATRNAVILGP